MASIQDPPAQTAQTADVVTVDLRKALVEMAAQQGEKVEDLGKGVAMTREEYYTAVIKTHYKAVDTGYARGLADGLRARWPWFVWFVAGAATPYVVTFAVKLVAFVGRVYNS